MGGQADRVTVLLVGDDSAAPLDNALLAALATRLKHSFQARRPRGAGGSNVGTSGHPRRFVCAGGPCGRYWTWHTHIHTTTRANRRIGELRFAPLGSADEDFDVRTAQCAAAADQERLLAVIESSFIDLRSFNSSVQILFGRILRESIAPWQAGSPFSRSNLTSRQSSQSESESTKDDYFVSIACDMPLQFESTRRMLR
eukprot:6183767-Pleurochrysis_carterae.AAC.2